ncbi:Rv3654c family TadE-like protein [Pseudonocardia alni]|uniref:Rv3654c family TadE-like protein n=1 Tax=Pseudonocardia alni TaxID=33907 RepID=UPI001AD638FF|nr:Rv3654c family TadE-like protein [Pseudonocardia alni]MBO4239466.1 helicase [Pseudonocardia alni]
MSRPVPPRRGDDAGVASVWAATAAAVLLLVGIVGVDLAAATRARHVASAAADLSALAAAGRSVDGTAVACARAAELASRNGAELLTCRLDGWDAMVETRVAWSGLLPLRGPARARARAGPAPVDTGPPPASGTVDGSGPTAEPS